MEESLANKWQGLLLLESSTIQDAIHLLEKTALRIVMIVDSFGNLIGTISDGDVRRGILRGIELNQSVLQVVEKNALVVPPGIGREMIIQLMSVNKIHQIPIVDGSNKVLGIHLWDEINRLESVENLMVIMAGGRGTRLYPQTQNCPKPMLEINNKPILEIILEQCIDSGLKNFYFSVLPVNRFWSILLRKQRLKDFAILLFQFSI